MPRSPSSPTRATSAPACATSPAPWASARARSTTTSPARKRCSKRCSPPSPRSRSSGCPRFSTPRSPTAARSSSELAEFVLDRFVLPRQQQLFRILMSDGMRLAREGRINLLERMGSTRPRFEETDARLIDAGFLRERRSGNARHAVHRAAAVLAPAARHRREDGRDSQPPRLRPRPRRSVSERRRRRAVSLPPCACAACAHCLTSTAMKHRSDTRCPVCSPWLSLRSPWPVPRCTEREGRGRRRRRRPRGASRSRPRPSWSSP